MLPSIRFDSEFVCGVWGVQLKTRHEEQSEVASADPMIHDVFCLYNPCLKMGSF